MKVACGILFEGVGGPDPTRQLVIGYGDLPTSSAWSWQQGLTAPPEIGTATIDPVRGEWQVAGLVATVSATDAIASLLQREDRGLTYALTGAVTASSTTITISPPLPPGTERVWIGDETLDITDASAAPTYTVTRGRLGSPAQAHPATARVSTFVPYWVPRPIALVYADLDEGVEWLEWRGYVDAIQSAGKGETLQIEGTEFYSRWSQATANRGAPDLGQRAHTVQITGNRLFGRIALPEGARTRKTTGEVAVQISGALVRARYGAISQTLVLDSRDGEGLLGSALVARGETYERVVGRSLGVTVTETAERATPHTGSIYEILVWDKASGLGPTSGTDRYHPLRIVSYLIEGQAPWGLSLPIDAASFSAARDATRGLEIDHLVLGWDGKEYKPFEVAEQIMRAYGFAPTITRDGRYGVKRFDALDLRALSEVQGDLVSPYTDGPLQWRAPLAAGVSVIEASVGGLPWLQPTTLTVDASSGSRRSVLLKPREVVRYELPTVDARRAVDVALSLATTAEILHYGLPRLTVRVPDWRRLGVKYDLLSDLILADLGTLVTPWWVDAQGVRVGDLTGRIDALGRIVERKLDTRSRTYELTLLLVAWRTGRFARERAPAGIVTAVDTSDDEIVTITLSDDLHDTEAQYFTSEDRIARWTLGGELIAVLERPVLDVIGATITVRKPVTAPAVGEVIRLASSTVYSSSVRYPLTDRPYVYYADTSGEIARAAGVELADPYGGSFGVL